MPVKPSAGNNEAQRLRRENRRLKRELETALRAIDIPKSGAADGDQSARRRVLSGLIAEVSPGQRRLLCALTGLSRSRLYDRSNSATDTGTPRRPHHRALSAAERQAVLDVLHEARFVDRASAEVYATLLDEARVLALVAKLGLKPLLSDSSDPDKV